MLPLVHAGGTFFRGGAHRQGRKYSERGRVDETFLYKHHEAKFSILIPHQMSVFNAVRLVCGGTQAGFSLRFIF
jgi:hypothetical protein